MSWAAAWFLQVPGFLLLRDELDGSVHCLPPDDSGQIMQASSSDCDFMELGLIA
jgi:hypothetical protein